MGKGRSGGYRMLVAYRSGDRAVFLFGFAKNARENIEPDELDTLRELAADMLALAEAALDRLKDAKELEEVGRGDGNEEAE